VTRTMYDALNPDNIPSGATMVAHYVDVISEADARKRWPNAVLLSIARNFNEDAHCCDTEPTDLTPDQVPAWLQRQRQRGVDNPWNYSDRSEWPQVQQACQAAGVAQPAYWVAWPGATAIPPGAVAVQRDFHGDYDVSLVNDFVPGLDQGPPSAVFGPTIWGDNVESFRGVVQARGGNGWCPLPANVDPNRVISVVVDQQKPDAPGVGYRRVPLFVGLATGPATPSGQPELVFENPADFEEPDGGFGFVVWWVSN
jgi:hypothetical protein